MSESEACGIISVMYPGIYKGGCLIVHIQTFRGHVPFYRTQVHIILHHFEVCTNKHQTHFSHAKKGGVRYIRLKQGGVDRQYRGSNTAYDKTQSGANSA